LSELFFQEYSVTVNWTGGGDQCPYQCSNRERHVNDYACSWGTGNWNQGRQYFLDPLPNGFLILNARLKMFGQFDCLGRNTSLRISVSGAVLKNGIIITPESGCFCPNCVVEETVANPAISIYDWARYKYGGVNTLSVEVLNENAICLSSVIIYFNATSALPTLQSVSPLFVPLEGGTNLIIRGSYFVSYFSYGCVIANKTYPADFQNETTVNCTAPPHPQGPENVSFDFVLIYPNVKQHDQSRFLTYYVEPTLNSVLPDRGPVGTVVKIEGSTFFPSSEISCKFGDTVVPGVYIDVNHLQCTAPSITPLENNTVTLTISMNGQNWAPSSLSYTYGDLSPDGKVDIIWIISIGVILFLGTMTSVAFLVYQRYQKRSAYERIPNSARKTRVDMTTGTVLVDMREVVLKERIGRGSVGDVYRGYWRGTEIAVKKMPTVNFTPNFMKEMLREAEIMKSIRHPNILTFMGASTEWPDVCIITEYMPRGSLWQILHNPNIQLSWDLKRKMAIDACTGMNFLHCSNIIHRDLKSHNLLVDQNWKVKVADFGLSKMIEEKCISTMTACGTPCWTAPEVLRHQRYSVKADVYSFGICLWEMATREDPYQNIPPFQVILQVATKGLRPEIPPDCPQEWAQLIRDCWADDPDQRPTFAEVQQRLQTMILPP